MNTFVCINNGRLKAVEKAKSSFDSQVIAKCVFLRQGLPRTFSSAVTSQCSSTGLCRAYNIHKTRQRLFTLFILQIKPGCGCKNGRVFWDSGPKWKFFGFGTGEPPPSRDADNKSKSTGVWHHSIFLKKKGSQEPRALTS